MKQILRTSLNGVNRELGHRGGGADSDFSVVKHCQPFRVGGIGNNEETASARSRAGNCQTGGRSGGAQTEVAAIRHYETGSSAGANDKSGAGDVIRID